MDNKIRHIINSFLVLLLFSSCVDILDKKPLTEIGENVVWEDPVLVKAFVNARYNRIGHGWAESWMSSTVDETYLTWSRGCEPITQGFVNPSDLGCMNYAMYSWNNREWSTIWKNISNCNLFFERIEQVPFTNEKEKTVLKGEVRFIRILMYHDLISRWGGMPLIEKSFTLNDIEEILAIKRSSYKDCVDYMVSELDKAVQELPHTRSGQDKGRATSVAALALKSRILLYAASDLMNINVKSEYVGYLNPDPNRWAKAAEAAEVCIRTATGNGYALYDKYGEDVKQKYTQLFLECGNEEVLFDREGTSSEDGGVLNSLDQLNGPNGYGQWGGNTPISEFVDAFEMEDGSSFDWKNQSHARNPYANRDKRLYATVLCDNDEWMGRNVEVFINADASGNELTSGGLDTKYGIDAWNTSITGYNMRKFLDERYIPNSRKFYPKSWIWLRLGEQYLNLAEARYMEGKENEARSAVNMIRQRARMPLITASGNALLDKIRNERRIELCFEEHRYFDLRRWKIAEKYLNKVVTGITILKLPDGTKKYIPGKVVEERKFIERMYWLPIPKSEMDKSPAFQQNPGY